MLTKWKLVFEISNAIAHGGNSVIEEQVTNGVAVRMALLYQLTLGQGQQLARVLLAALLQ